MAFYEALLNISALAYKNKCANISSNE